MIWKAPKPSMAVLPESRELHLGPKCLDVANWYDHQKWQAVICFTWEEEALVAGTLLARMLRGTSRERHHAKLQPSVEDRRRKGEWTMDVDG